MQSTDICVNGTWRPLPCQLLHELLPHLGYAWDARGIALAVNSQVIPRSGWAAHVLHAGDVIDVVGAVQGG